MENWTIVGTLASVGGVFLGVWVLLTAKGAKKAAEDALEQSRRRGLVEEIEEASRKIQQIGDHSTTQEWGVVRVRADELVNCFRAILTRWPDHLSEESRNSPLTATTLVISIKRLSCDSALTPLTESQRRKASQAQTRTNEILGTVLGEARRKQERNEG
jgi:hypothetical protein